MKRIRSIERLLLLFFCLSVWGMQENRAKAAELEAFSAEYEEIDAVLKEIGMEEDTPGFRELVAQLLKGEYGIEAFLEAALKSGRNDWKKEWTGMLKILAIAVMAAVFTNFSQSLKQGQAAETGFFVSYLLIAGSLLTAFAAAKELAQAVLSQMLEFMRILLPTYCMGVAFTNGSISAAAFYQGTLLAIAAAEFVMLKLVLPLCHLYFLLSIINDMIQEDFLSRLTELVYKAAELLMKTVTACVIGIGTIRGMLAPAADALKQSAVLKAVSALPGVGNLLDGVTQTVLSAGVLLRNTIGVAGAVFLLLICAAPIIRLFLLAMSYHVGAALLQPVSDKRILFCLTAAGKAHSLLLQIVFYTALLFLLAILLIAASLGVQ